MSRNQRVEMIQRNTAVGVQQYTFDVSSPIFMSDLWCSQIVKVQKNMGAFCGRIERRNRYGKICNGIRCGNNK